MTTWEGRVAIDTTVPNSPGWWALRLWTDLRAKHPEYERLNSYYEGKPPLVHGTENQRRAFYRFQQQSRTNFAEMIVQAGVERCATRAIKTAADSDDSGDQVAWELWTANDLDVDSSDVDQWAWTFGEAYYIESGGADGEKAVITGEDPRYVITATDPIRKRKARAAFKIVHDDALDLDLVYVWVPGELHVAYRSRKSRGADATFSPASFTWAPGSGTTFDYPVNVGAGNEPVDGYAGPLSQQYATQDIPVHKVLGPGGVGAFARHTDLLDRINHMLLQRLVIATLQAFRQRGLKIPEGVDLPDTDADGNKIDYNDLFAADPGAMWKIPDGMDIWESAQVDLTPILSSVKDDVLHLSAVTRTPLTMFTPDAATQTAEGASMQREGIVYKVENYLKRKARVEANVIGTAFQFMGDDKRADASQIKVDYAPVERFSLSERASADSQASLPFRDKLRVIWQMDPAEIDQAVTNRADDLVYAQQLATVQAAAQAGAAPPAP